MSKTKVITEAGLVNGFAVTLTDEVKRGKSSKGYIKVGPNKGIYVSGVIDSDQFFINPGSLAQITQYLKPSELFKDFQSLKASPLTVDFEGADETVKIWVDVSTYVKRYPRLWFKPGTKPDGNNPDDDDSGDLPSDPKDFAWQGFPSRLPSFALCAIAPIFLNFGSLIGRYLADLDSNTGGISKIATEYSGKLQISKLRAYWIAHIGILCMFKGLDRSNPSQLANFATKRFNVFCVATGYASNDMEITTEHMLAFSTLGQGRPLLRKAIILGLFESPDAVAQATLNLLRENGMATYRLTSTFLDCAATGAHLLPDVLRESMRYRELYSQIEALRIPAEHRPHIATLYPSLFTYKQADFPSLTTAAVEYAKRVAGDSLQYFKTRTYPGVNVALIRQALDRKLTRSTATGYSEEQIAYLKKEGLYQVEKEIPDEMKKEMASFMKKLVSKGYLSSDD